MSLGPITWDAQVHLVSLVMAAKNIIDLGVEPVRVWLLRAECERHTKTIEDEVAVPLTQQPPGILTCPLCVVGKYWPTQKNATAVLLRG